MREGGGDGLFGGKLGGKRPGSLPGWRVVLPERSAILTHPWCLFLKTAEPLAKEPMSS